MKRALLIVGASLLAAGCMDQGPREPSAGEQSQLDAALAGYEQSGPPVSCVSMRDLHGNRSVGEHAVIFDGTTRATLYVNRPPAGCPEIGTGRALITKTPTDRLCRGDIADVFDTASRTSYGSCALGDFTPYRRVKR